MAPESVVATRELLARPKAGGELRKVVICVGKPVWREDGFAVCPIEWDGLFSERLVMSAPGVDLMQAIFLATNADDLVRGFGDSYEFFWPDGDKYFDESA